MIKLVQFNLVMTSLVRGANKLWHKHEKGVEVKKKRFYWSLFSGLLVCEK